MMKACICYFLAALFLFYMMALQVSPSIMTEVLMQDFAIQAGALGVMASIYFYSYTLMQIPAGMLLDRWSLRGLLSIACLICAGGSLLFAYTHVVEIAALARFLMGLGSALAFVGVLTVASLYFPAKYFAFFAGVTQLLAALGAMGGEVPLSYLVNHYGWREVMGALGWAGVLLSLMIFLVMRGKKTADGAAEFTFSLKRIFRSKQNYWIALYAFTGWGPMAVFATLWGIPFVMLKYKLSNVDAAAAVMMMWLGVGLISPLLGYLSDLVKRRRMFLKMCSLVGVVFSLIVLYADISLPAFYGALFMMGAASGGQLLCFPLMKDNNAPAVASTAMGLTNMAVVAGGALLQPLTGLLLTSTGTYEVALIIVPLCYLVGYLSSWMIEEIKPH